MEAGTYVVITKGSTEYKGVYCWETLAAFLLHGPSAEVQCGLLENHQDPLKEPWYHCHKESTQRYDCCHIRWCYIWSTEGRSQVVQWTRKKGENSCHWRIPMAKLAQFAWAELANKPNANGLPNTHFAWMNPYRNYSHVLFSIPVQKTMKDAIKGQKITVYYSANCYLPSTISF